LYASLPFSTGILAFNNMRIVRLLEAGGPRGPGGTDATADRRSPGWPNSVHSESNSKSKRPGETQSHTPAQNGPLAPDARSQAYARTRETSRARAAPGRPRGAEHVVVGGPLVVWCGCLGRLLDYVRHCDSTVWMRDLDHNSVNSREGIVAASFHSVRTDPGVPGEGSDSL
jgi:hypothetical protein